MTQRMIFLSLPVRDLSASRRFYEGLGFPDQRALLRRADGVGVGRRDMVVTLQTHDRFAELAGADAGDPSRPTAVPCLTVEDRAEVDELVAKAAAAGGGERGPGRAEEARYTGSFTDPDGNVWQVLWLDQLHVVN
jgi:predicted lactoylglutathione lyase